MGRFDKYQFRCSALGKIMSAKGEITTGNATYLNELFIGEMYGIRKDVTSKYFEKGVYCEEDGITLLNQTLYKGKLLLKNKDRLRNDHIHGESDCIAPDGIVYDIKNAFDRFTFGKAGLTYEYEWQLRGYMWLWGKDKARLFYCLNNMPEHLLCAEERKLFYANHFVSTEDEEYQKLCEELRAKHNYDHMPLHERFRVWDVEHDEKKIDHLKAKIDKCRAYLNQLADEWQNECRLNIELMGADYSIIIAHADPDGVVVINKEQELKQL